MISSRWKKVWSDFWSNRGRTLLTIVTIAVGTFAVGFNSNLGLYMNESMDGDYLSANPSEAECTPQTWMMRVSRWRVKYPAWKPWRAHPV
ncbi:MAG: hypothetical protein IPJ47_19955 [Anaerolineales bacterium]|nr:hypothetical protein [Anaerolineales bacterium]